MKMVMNGQIYLCLELDMWYTNEIDLADVIQKIVIARETQFDNSNM